MATIIGGIATTHVPGDRQRDRKRLAGRAILETLL